MKPLSRTSCRYLPSPVGLALIALCFAAPAAAQTTAPVPRAETAAEKATREAEARRREAEMREACDKLTAAVGSCRKIGGWKQDLCEKGAQAQHDKCPIPLDKLAS